MNTPMARTAPCSTIDAFGHLRARADEAVVFDDHRSGLQRLEHAADAGAARDVHVPADLGAAAHGRPGVDHGAAIDIGAEIDEAGHQDNVRRDVRGVADHTARHRAKTRARELGFTPAGELGGHLVPPAGAARPALDRAQLIQAKGQQHGLLQPLLHAPLAVHLVRDAQASRIQSVERRIDRRAHRPSGIRADLGAPLEGVVDHPLERGLVHAWFLPIVAPRMRRS